MSFITFNGTEVENPYLLPLLSLRPPTSHIQLSHISLGDRLILAECDEKPYENYRTGQTRSEGRSILGSIRLRGNNWKKQQWECNFFVRGLQISLFEEMLEAQQNEIPPVILNDRWLSGAAVAPPRNVWLDVDRQYLSLVSPDGWHRLQFQALEI